MRTHYSPRHLLRAVLAAAAACTAGVLAPVMLSQMKLPVSPAVSGSYVVVFHEGAVSESAMQRLSRAGVRAQIHNSHLGTAAMQMSSAAAKLLAADPVVEQVVPDRVVYAHSLLRSTLVRDLGGNGLAPVKASGPLRSILQDAPAPAVPNSGSGTNTSPHTIADTFYADSPQGWAVRSSGGYGTGFLGGTVAGPWNQSLVSGVRIAVLDSGVDRTHPDLAPNLALNISEVDTAASPSPCDDGSSQDQQGHGTWVASLAAGAMGKDTGRVVGVAPSASLLNIKVLQRTPGSGATLAARCAAGQAAGLVSWLLKGIDDAIAQRADVIVLSLGSIVDLYTGDGAGLKVAFDRATHAANKAGVLVVAAAGNDAFDLSNPEYVELPAQARDVLAVIASTNPDCAENNQAGAMCASGTVTVPYYSNYGSPLNAVAAPGEITRPVQTRVSPDGCVEPAQAVCPARLTVFRTTQHTPSVASTLATRPMCRPWAPVLPQA